MKWFPVLLAFWAVAAWGQANRGELRFSPLTQISDQNVAQLGLAWSADLDTARGQEATPLMHEGVLYSCDAGIHPGWSDDQTASRGYVFRVDLS